MPLSAPRVCGCGTIVPSGQRCRTCEATRKREVDTRRGSAQERGYTAAWQRAAKAFLALPQNQLCACGCGGRATTVDHIEPHRGIPLLFWSKSNWQGLTHRCHSRKTAKADGGFGNPKRPHGGVGNDKPWGADRAGPPRANDADSALGFGPR